MEWNEGYVSDIEYESGFFRELAPAYLNFCSLLHGVEPVPLDRPFTYCELGCGQGFTTNLLAASNPQARFWAADFMPAHVARAERLAADAGLDNITFLEQSFADLAAGKIDGLPQFDFITMYGVYTWVGIDNRRHIAEFLRRYLKPGGIVYLNYNAMPGWAGMLPLQRLLYEHVQAHTGARDERIRHAVRFIAHAVEAGAGCFAAAASSPGLQRCLDALQTASPAYIAHEYLNRDWQPASHAEVVRDLSGTKLDYIGSAD